MNRDHGIRPPNWYRVASCVLYSNRCFTGCIFSSTSSGVGTLARDFLSLSKTPIMHTLVSSDTFIVQLKGVERRQMELKGVRRG